jgi:ATP-dependent protease HslVU (ClpYQ) ATPase subunit
MTTPDTTLADALNELFKRLPLNVALSALGHETFMGILKDREIEALRSANSKLIAEQEELPKKGKVNAR